MSALRRLTLTLAAAAALTACSGGNGVADPRGAQPAAATAPAPTTSEPAMPEIPADPTASRPAPSKEVATLGAGCFWCVEAVLEQLPGVLDVTSGYMGGHVENPTYEQVCGKKTGHVEVAQVTFDPARLSYTKLLDWFFKLHDPTTKDRQGGDAGPQYRSAIFFHSEAQRAAAEAKVKELTEARAFAAPIVTEIVAASTYYEAEDYHQDYYRFNKDKNPYCQVVIRPKLDKLGLQK